MATKPSSQFTWVPGDEPSKISEPTTEKKAEGWLPEEKPPFQWFNWMFNLIAKWSKYLEDKTDENTTAINNNATALTAVSGTVGSHTSTLNSHTSAINTLNSDLDIAEGEIDALQTDIVTKVAKAGDSMSGELSIAIGGTTLSIFQQILRSRATGLISGGLVTVNADTSKIDIAAGVGSYLNQSDPTALAFQAVTWTAKTAVTLTNLGTARATYVGISAAGATVQQTTPPTLSQRRDTIWLAVVHHINNAAVNSIGLTPDFLIGPQNQLRDLVASIGIINTSGNVLSANGANLKLNKTAGALFALGANYSAAPKSPNVVSISALTALSFTYSTQTTGVGASITDLIPGSYDVAGTVTAIPGANSRATNQRVYLTAEGTLQVYYGQQYYNSLADAVAAIASEQVTLTEGTKNNAVLIGIVSLVKNATALNNSGQAIFTPVSKFGVPIASGSGSGGLTPEPQNAAFTAVSGKRYLLDLTAAIPIAMPQGAPGAQVTFFDALGKADKINGYIGTITPFTGDKFQGMATDEPLQLDGKYQRIEAYWDTANNQWDWDTNTSVIVQPAGPNNAGSLKAYEEGDFSPYLESTGGGSILTGARVGSFTRIGRVVYYTVIVVPGTTSGLNAGSLKIAGLPYTATNPGNGVSWGASLGESRSITYPTGANQLYAGVVQGSSRIDLAFLRTGTTALNVTVANIDSGLAITVSGFYHI